MITAYELSMSEDMPMICQCCRYHFQSSKVQVFKTPPNKEFLICPWCTWMLNGFLESVIQGANLKIQWGNRSIYRPHWIELKRFLLRHYPLAEKTRIIENGAGLSTELLLLEGYKVTSYEPAKWYADMCKRFHKNVHAYQENEGPPPLDQRFNFGLVDAPQLSGARQREAAHAIGHVDDYIYMHDPEAGQVAVLEEAGWRPMKQWSSYKGYCRFYEAPRGGQNVEEKEKNQEDGG